MSSQVLSFEVALDLIFELINKKKTQSTKGKFLEAFSTLQHFNLRENIFEIF